MFYGGIRYLLFLFSLVEKPAWSNVFGMAVLLFSFMVIRGLFGVILFVYRCYKNPDFKQAHMRTGMDWKTYNRLMNDEHGLKG